MSKRRLTLRSETLSALDTDELSGVVGGISAPHVACVVFSTGAYSQCPSCGIACTYQCTTTTTG